MDLLHGLADLFLHLDRHLAEAIQQYGGYAYALLFLIVFLETGLVVTPILPGDSLLFAAGSFAALVAGIGRMSYARFLAYNLTGGVLWVAVCVFSGYFFGNLSFVKRNFSLVIIAIVLVSLLPALVEYLRHRLAARRAPAA